MKAGACLSGRAVGEQIGSSGSLSTALNGAQRLSSAANGVAFLQVVCEVAGQRLADRPFTREGSTALNGFEPHRIAAAHESFERLTCKDSTSRHCLRVGTEWEQDSF